MSAPALLDRFVPRYDVRGRHQVTIHAPAGVVMETARNFEIESLWIIRSLFRLRAWMLGSGAAERSHAGFIQQMESLGWALLAEDRDRY